MKIVILILIQCLFLLPAVGLADESSDFIGTVKNEAFEIYVKNLSDKDRFTQFCEVVSKRINVEKMGTLVLGRHLKKFDEKQFGTFLKFFNGTVVRLFDTSFSKMAGGVVTIDPNSREQSGVNAVEVMVEPPNRTPVRMQFYVSKNPQAGNALQIEDAAMSGIKLVFTKRTQYDSVMSKAGNENPGSEAATLLAEMEKSETLCP